MTQLFTSLLNDEAGFIVSAELILISTIVILGLVAGLSEISFAVNNELEDVASAVGSLNQSFYVAGQNTCHKGGKAGSSFSDSADECDSEWGIQGSGVSSEN